VLRRFKLHTLMTVAALLAIHVGAFVVMWFLVSAIMKSIVDLNSTGLYGWDLLREAEFRHGVLRID